MPLRSPLTFSPRTFVVAEQPRQQTEAEAGKEDHQRRQQAADGMACRSSADLSFEKDRGRTEKHEKQSEHASHVQKHLAKSETVKKTVHCPVDYVVVVAHGFKWKTSIESPESFSLFSLPCRTVSSGTLPFWYR